MNIALAALLGLAASEDLATFKERFEQELDQFIAQSTNVEQTSLRDMLVSAGSQLQTSEGVKGLFPSAKDTEIKEGDYSKIAVEFDTKTGDIAFKSYNQDGRVFSTREISGPATKQPAPIEEPKPAESEKKPEETNEVAPAQEVKPIEKEIVEEGKLVVNLLIS